MRKTKKLVKTKRAVCALTAGILAAGMIMPAFAQDDAIAPKSAIASSCANAALSFPLQELYS